jgi:hypothetical protein
MGECFSDLIPVRATDGEPTEKEAEAHPADGKSDLEEPFQLHTLCCHMMPSMEE